MHELLKFYEYIILIFVLELSECRPDNCENNRRQFYKCKRCIQNIGQMEAISRHYNLMHPTYRSDLRNLITRKERLISIRNCCNSKLLQFEIIIIFI